MHLIICWEPMECVSQQTWGKIFYYTPYYTPIFKHSLLECWAFAQHCLSISTTVLLISVLTFLTILISDPSLTKFSLILRIPSRASVFAMLYASTLFWSDKAVPIISLFDNLSNIPSDYAGIVEILFSCR